MLQLGDFVAVLLPQGREGSGRVIAIEGEAYAVERDDCENVTWHSRDELARD
jgi:hypothetical protein